MSARLVCGICETTTHVAKADGPDIVIVCEACKVKLRRELNGACIHRPEKKVQFVPKAA